MSLVLGASGVPGPLESSSARLLCEPTSRESGVLGEPGEAGELSSGAPGKLISLVLGALGVPGPLESSSERLLDSSVAAGGAGRAGQAVVLESTSSRLLDSSVVVGAGGQVDVLESPSPRFPGVLGESGAPGAPGALGGLISLEPGLLLLIGKLESSSARLLLESGAVGKVGAVGQNSVRLLLDEGRVIQVLSSSPRLPGNSVIGASLISSGGASDVIGEGGLTAVALGVSRAVRSGGASDVIG